MSIEQAVLEKLRTLPTNKQQEVLDFVEFLQGRLTQAERINRSSNSEISALEAAQQVLGVIGDDPEEISPSEEAEVSFLDAAREFVGCVDGSGDLSTNPKYMNGYGK